jgi:hypothetical protein
MQDEEESVQVEFVIAIEPEAVPAQIVRELFAKVLAASWLEECVEAPEVLVEEGD